MGKDHVSSTRKGNEMNGSKLVFVCFFSTALCLNGHAQSTSGSGISSAKTPVLTSLRSGIALFSEGKYNEALSVFDSIFLDAGSGDLRPEGAYWSAMTNIAKGDQAAAEKVMETFLMLFPHHARLPEILYQQGRVAYLQQKYDKSLQVFQVYINAYPAGEFYPASVFWSAESLYALGRLQEAEKLFRTIEERFADSPKAEASRYRLSLIRFKYREEELLTLLKWSHEESLKVLEEFQRREKAYEQALSVYQKRYGDVQRGVSSAQVTMEEEIAILKKSLDDLTKALNDKDLQIKSLTAGVSQAGAPAASAPPTVALTPDKELLALKERALNLMLFYMENVLTGSGGNEK